MRGAWITGGLNEQVRDRKSEARIGILFLRGRARGRGMRGICRANRLPKEARPG